MSTDAFTPVVYPALAASEPAGARTAQARGYAAGYVDGMRRAGEQAADAERHRAAAHQAALADADARLQRTLAVLDAAIARVQALSLPLVDEVEESIIGVGLHLAETILQREVTGGHARAVDALRRAMAAAPRDELVAVRLHPADLQALPQPLEPTTRLLPDATLEPGDAIAELRDGWLDLRLSAALDRARTALAGEDA
ncbi:FliH/SctL family protein [Curtobacterium ammoniigenes]|uniref:FliH/SctL family protein n=1 Tax=Curtobacterium ammoniigenes TaxID=395387 RepID=UPI0008334013|nr:FliH/SctL family protein [Curtobacterium ammoniigenes]